MNYNILVAEDDKDLLELIYMHLIKENYNVIKAHNGLKALENFSENKINLVILDINMPKMDGFQFLNKIRSSSKVPIIIMTARGSDEDKILGLGLGADDYLIKPISMLELVARVKAHFRRNYEYIDNANTKNEKLKSGNIVLDLEEFSVKVKGKQINLNPKELNILKYLMVNKGKVFTKKQIYENVWDEYYYENSNTVMVNISNLRNKISQKDDFEYIENIRGIGYRFQGFEDEEK